MKGDFLNPQGPNEKKSSGEWQTWAALEKYWGSNFNEMN